jgi:phosphoglycolate phosphatase
LNLDTAGTDGDARTGKTIALFDIDLTLVDFADDRVVLRDVIETLTDDPELHALDPTGRSDRWIVSQLAHAAGVSPADLMPTYQATYAERLEAGLADNHSIALPGAIELLGLLAASRGVVLGIATGNLRASAILKLRHAALDGLFSPLRGAFGDHSPERAEIVAAAAVDCGREAADRLVFVGDTDRDVEAAKQVGAVPVGIATGRYDARQLWDAGAAAVFEDLRDWRAVGDVILDGDAEYLTPVGGVAR